MSETSAAPASYAGKDSVARAGEGASAFQHGYFRIENVFVDYYMRSLGAIPAVVWVVLGRFADNQTGRCYPSIRTIAEILHLSQKTVLKAIAELEKEGLVKVERRRTKNGERQANVYTLLPLRGPPRDSAPVLHDVQHRAGGDTAEQDLINTTQENKREGAPARRTPTQALPRDPNLDHPAVAAYRETCKVTPNETQRAALAATVTDLPRWQEVMRRWLLKGYQKTNVDGMLDWYKNGIPEWRGGNGTNAAGRRPGFQGNRLYERPESRAPETPDERARRDAEFKLLKQSRDRSQNNEV